jgi:hypothetical protein
VAETTNHFADSATIAFCGINRDKIPHDLLPPERRNRWIRLLNLPDEYKKIDRKPIL